MKIAFFADSFKPYLSGVTNSIEILANELRALGHRVFIFAPGYPGHIDNDPDVRRFPSIASGQKNFRLALPLIREMPEIDIVHSHSPFQAGLLARFVSRQKGVPLVYSFHTLFTRYVHYARFVPARLAKMGIAAYLRAYANGADRIVAPSEMAKRALCIWGVKAPVDIIPSGIERQHYPADPSAKRVELRQKYGLPHDAKVLLYAGRLSKEKNLPFILKAYSKLASSDTKLVLVGGGPLEAELKSEKSKVKNIVFTGEIPYPEILSYYCLGDIFLFSSLTETQGLVLAEAKAAGLPIVALFAGGLVNTVRSGIDGYLVRRDLKVYVEHVQRLLNDDQLCHKMSRAARADAQERFAAPVVAKQVEAVYNSLIKSREA